MSLGLASVKFSEYGEAVSNMERLIGSVDAKYQAASREAGAGGAKGKAAAKLAEALFNQLTGLRLLHDLFKQSAGFWLKAMESWLKNSSELVQLAFTSSK